MVTLCISVFHEKLHKYVRNLHYTDPTGGEIYFNEKREVPADLILHSWMYHNETDVYQVPISIIKGPEFVFEINLNISQSIFWKSGEIPVYLAAEKSLDRQFINVAMSVSHVQKEKSPTFPVEFLFVNSENCMKCLDEECPNEKKDRCVPRVVEFLSYTDDPIVGVFSAVSILCCLLTGLILGIFIHYQDTPIVKANNRNLSYLLLVSIMLSFLCVFLFLGHPVDVTCMLRVTSFGVIFSVAVSSLLAKSIMVCIAFKATKPGSPWRKWMGTKLPNSIICVFSLVQVIICVTWLSISPPFQDRDTHSYQGKIIIQCNEGSVIGFYSVLGYMGLLAAVSFIIAFLARTLPDSFNEAKYITFSMLVFSSRV
ncbi:vomeronasal type-2 receptor 26-like [Rana temporaria]|uniref:vomeronasal type-2 receptor 26-like n=1 Tax=Rana temporaria TaxID=8407 RepID=UPI001AACA4D0|nr:vomeronasal type-2 receptor 26-like [Rana temporaria]